MTSPINLPPPARVAIGEASINGKTVEVFISPEWARYFQTLNTTVSQTVTIVTSTDATGAHVGLLDETGGSGDDSIIAIPGPKGDTGDPGQPVFMLQEPDHSESVTRPFAGDSENPRFDTPSIDNLVISKDSGDGIRVDNASPSFGWKDLIGDVVPKTTGAGSPPLDTFRDDVRWFSYGSGDDGDIVFHIPHDYVPGTDLFIHVHWAHNGTNITGSIDVRFHLTYAKGHNQANFSADVEPHLVVGSLTIANTPQYRHRLDEIQCSTTGGSATLLNTTDIEIDGIIGVHYDLDTIPTITGGTGKPFIFAIDLHYQSTGIPTKQKSPNFYV